MNPSVNLMFAKPRLPVPVKFSILMQFAKMTVADLLLDIHSNFLNNECMISDRGGFSVLVTDLPFCWMK